jgi:hypothetical protein
MKYLVVKSLLGFGDRLESLKMCVKYALDNNLKIFVDWTDDVWGIEPQGFYKYFSLDMPTMTLEQLDGLSVHPPFWKGKLMDKLTNEIFNDKTSEIGILNGTYDADVVVVKCAGYRSIFADSRFFTDRFKVIDRRITDEVKRRQDVYKLSDKWGIHLRGQDRASSYEYKSNRVTALGIKLVANGIFSNKAVVVSDDEDYIKIWNQRWPDHPVITSITLQGIKGGTHRVLNPSVSKDLLNVNLLIDFLTLASCSRVFTSAPDSRFAREAINFHSEIKRII